MDFVRSFSFFLLLVLLFPLCAPHPRHPDRPFCFFTPNRVRLSSCPSPSGPVKRPRILRAWRVAVELAVGHIDSTFDGTVRSARSGQADAVGSPQAIYLSFDMELFFNFVSSPEVCSIFLFAIASPVYAVVLLLSTPGNLELSQLPGNQKSSCHQSRQGAGPKKPILAFSCFDQTTLPAKAVNQEPSSPVKTPQKSPIHQEEKRRKHQTPQEHAASQSASWKYFRFGGEEGLHIEIFPYSVTERW